jgi:riboflavin synthase
MFTGLVEAMGEVAALQATAGGRRLTIGAPALAGALAVGDSVAVNGCCLTVIAGGADSFDVEAVPETLRRTTIGTLNQGDRVNLERAMRLDGRLDGHLVQGHVDAVGVVRDARNEGAGRRVAIEAPAELRAFLAPKGSIAVDGISLTIASAEGDRFEVALIPHTLEHTTAKSYRAGSRVNLEVDLIARYVARRLEVGGGAS